MAIIYSTDEAFSRANRNRLKNCRKQSSAYFFCRKDCDYRLCFSADIARKVFGQVYKKCVLGFDDEKNELLIVPNNDGNINLGQSGGRCVYEYTPLNRIQIKRFADFVGLIGEKKPLGHFHCTVDENNTIHVHLDRPYLS